MNDYEIILKDVDKIIDGSITVQIIFGGREIFST